MTQMQQMCKWRGWRGILLQKNMFRKTGLREGGGWIENSLRRRFVRSEGEGNSAVLGEKSFKVRSSPEATQEATRPLQQD